MNFYHYSVFGGLLRSELSLPSLRTTRPGPPTWELRISSDPPSSRPQELLGRVEVSSTVSGRLYCIPEGFRLIYDDTGTYDILAGGAQLRWYSVPGAPLDIVESDILGRVVALALHMAGRYCLHASAVAIAGGAIGLMAPKFHGKSTTSHALVCAGARLITDDTLAIIPGSPPVAQPGVHRIRLHEDSAEATGLEVGSLDQAAGKYLVGNFDDCQLSQVALPLRALYLLSPVISEGGGEAVVRRRLSATHSVLSLVAHAKAGALMGGPEAGLLLARATTIAASTPVYQLLIARDLSRLPEVVAQLLAWHDPSMASEELEALTP